MTIGNRVSNKLGRILRRAGDSGVEGTWIDVGAHLGETTLRQAALNPGLKVYAFEPNLTAAAKLIGRASNYFVIPMAVAEKDGLASLNVNSFDAASSLLPFNEASLQNWIGGEALKINSTVPVPTIRLDTFMNLAKIERVDFLKIDTQGMDLAVVKSAGSRLQDIAKITLEVDIKPVPLYEGAPSKEEVLTFLCEAGFSLVSVEKQSHDQEENLTFIRSDLARRLRDGESGK